MSKGKDWRFQINSKAIMLFERALDFVPGSYKLHHALERNTRHSYLSTVRNAQTREKLNHWTFLFRTVPISLYGKRVIEVGTGWSGVDLLFLHLFGCAGVLTLDKLPNLMLAQWVASIDGLLDFATEIEQTFSVNDVRQKLNNIPRNSLRDALAYCCVQYVVGKELSGLAIERGQYEMFYSYSTLQCLPRDHLRRTLAAGYAALAPGGVAFTDVRFIDNYYKGQRGMNPFGYLSYPERVMAMFQSRTFNPQSRIRHIQYLHLMEELGFELVRERTRRLEEGLLTSIRLDSQFANLPLEDLSISNATMIHRST